MRYFLLMIAILLLPGTSMATKAVAREAISAPKQCFQETANISVSFNGYEDEVAKISEILDKKFSTIKGLAEKNGLKKVELNSQNYSINAQSNNNYGRFRYNGSASFKIIPADKATDLLQKLSDLNYQANLNVNRYKKNQPCND